MNIFNKKIPLLRHPYYKLLKLKRGITLRMHLTWKCNFKCEYCPTELPDNYDYSKELSIVEWYDYIKRFPIKIKQIHILGGEPTLIPNIELLVNRLLKEGYFVTFYTNMSRPQVFDNIKRSLRFMIMTNYHKDWILSNKFLSRINDCKHQIKAGEFKELSNISNELRNIPVASGKDELDNVYKNTLNISPSGTIELTCWDVSVKNINK